MAMEITSEALDLQKAVSTFADAIRYNEKARLLGRLKHPGILAQLLIKQVVLLRIRDGNIERPDSEGHRDAILGVKASRRRQRMVSPILDGFRQLR